MNKEYIKDVSYPRLNDENFLYKIYKKREFYYYKIPVRKKLTDYNDIKKYREAQCTKDKQLTQNQLLPANIISPYTPYKGLILMHGVGVGKTLASIHIAEQFKEQVLKYQSKIYVLVPGPNVKENFKKELSDYIEKKCLTNPLLSKKELEYEKNIFFFNTLSYYKFLPYKSFY